MNILGRLWGRRKGGIYDQFLWIIGYRRDESDEDTISAMLKRQKQRMGKWWWFMSLGTVALTAVILGFQIWLIIHVVTYKIKKGVYRLRHRAPARRSKTAKPTRR